MDKLTRRQILRTGAGGIVGGIAMAYSPRVQAAEAAPTIAPDEPIRTGFIGIGGRGTGDLKAFLKQQGQEVVAVCDINPKNLNAAAELVKERQGKAPDLYDKGPDDFKRMLERKDIHAIVTATPCFEHARIMLAALQANKHIYGEKPLGITVKECDDLVAEAKARPKLVAQTGFQWMSNPRFIETIRRIHAGDIGTLIEGRFSRQNAAPPLKGWFSFREKSGDWMLEQACHEFNVMNWVAQATPLKAYGLGRGKMFRDGDPDRDVTDFYAAIIEFPNNFIVHYAHGWISPRDFKGMEQKVLGSLGGIEVGGSALAFVNRTKKTETIEAPGGDDTELAFKNFVTSIREGKPAAAPLSNGRNASLLALMVRKAVYERREVTWEEMLKTC